MIENNEQYVVHLDNTCGAAYLLNSDHWMVQKSKIDTSRYEQYKTKVWCAFGKAYVNELNWARNVSVVAMIERHIEQCFFNHVAIDVVAENITLLLPLKE